MTAGPHRDAENLGEATAFSLEDVHGYFEWFRRIKITVLIAVPVALTAAAFLIVWKVTHG